MKSLSQLIESVPASVTSMMMMKGKELAREGHDIVNLAGGEPDFDTPSHIMDAGIQAMRSGDTHYPPAFGTPELLEAICGKLERENHVKAEPAQILATPGAKWALYVALAAMLNPGDEVMILDPSWVSYGPMVELQRAKAVRVPLSSENDFLVTDEILGSYVNERTKVLMVTSPSNPTGRVLYRNEVDAIVKFAVEHDLYVISDEIYEHIVYDTAKHICLAAEDGMAERTIIVNGFSKAYAMTGWRLGWLAAPLPIAKLARTHQTQSITSAASFTMVAGAAALNGPQDCIREMVASYAERRRFILDAFEELPGIECPPMEGAFYAFPRFTHTEKKSLEISQILLEKGLIASTPGIAFGEAGEGHVRFSTATHMNDLEKLVDRLADILPQLA
ncbi:MAG: pyridoxal phosphate-dependent aminotransferase [Chloroflexota bacterium]